VQCDDGDAAVFATDGIQKTWVRDGFALAELVSIGLVKPDVNRINRAAIDSLALVGPAPVYEDGYAGPRTTA
jgi:hypothetical protein